MSGTKRWSVPDDVADLGARTSPAPGVRVTVEHLTRRLTPRRGRSLTVLKDVSFSIEPGELVAIVGGSGTGKSTLLEAIAGVSPADRGRVCFDGVDVYANLASFRTVIGYVPQDDIIHADLPLERTLQYAGRLRLPSGASASEVRAAVHDVMATLGLGDRAHVKVASLSGGQRKRASIASELLTHPHLFFLDEPTSGLDPYTSAELLDVLRALSARGTTVVFSTHSIADLGGCDRVVFLTRGGVVAFVGTVDEAQAWFGVDSIEEIYAVLATTPPEDLAARLSMETATMDLGDGLTAATPRLPRPRGGPVHQWKVLTQRALETLVRNRLTLAILLGSPALIVAMFAILFRPGAFDFGDPSPSSIVMIIFWVAFAAFFFGLTYGLLQICVERAILWREHLVGLRLGAYLASKVTVLVPFLLVVVVVMLAVLRAFDRLPTTSLSTYASIGVTLLLCATAALTLGLLTSAAVGNPSQATLALPMLCFPAVLFSGAILPVHLMAPVGAAISVVVPSRWAFEAIGHDLGVRRILADGGSSLGAPLLDSYGSAGLSATGTYWLILGVCSALFFAAAWFVLRRKAQTVPRS